MRWLLAIALLAVLAAPAHATDVTSSAPDTLSVTIYRDPDRAKGALVLDQLGGFALITETRRVSLPAGEARLRFEGVADGILPTTAIVAGLPGGVVEKNRDARLLTPAGLIEAALGQTVRLVRTNRRTGRETDVPARVVAGPDGGALLATQEGVEALHCSGGPERIVFDRAPDGLSARPTLSVLTRSAVPVGATVTLAYLARGFDWAANYVARVAADGRTMDLTGWVTLANGGSVGFPSARTQVVAGRVNADLPYIYQVFERRRTVCWPMATTKSAPLRRWSPAQVAYAMAAASGSAAYARSVMFDAAAPAPPPPPPPPPPGIAAEGLGDLKLYRVPHPTTVSARGQKQVLLLDQRGVPFERRYRWRAYLTGSAASLPATVQLRARNTLAAHLGLPLPSGAVAVTEQVDGRAMVAGGGEVGDSADGETVKLDVAQAPDVTLALAGPDAARVATLRNASPHVVTAVLQLGESDQARIADPRPGYAREDGLVTWTLPLAPGETRAIAFRVARRR